MPDKHCGRSAHSPENVAPACPSCNRPKNRRDLLQFLAYSTSKGAAA